MRGFPFACVIALGFKVELVGALEETLRTVRKLLDDRRANFRNRERLNRLLMLIQLEQLGLRNEARYARAIRARTSRPTAATRTVGG